MKNTKMILAGALLASCSAISNVQADNIVLTNDDGLTSNIKALYTALKAAGHDVIVSAPCSGQSGMGAAVKYLRPITPLTQPCLNNAAAPGAPGAGPVTKTEADFDYSDFYYVEGTPVMALAYGLDVLAQERWGSAPDLVLSGPNEGQNVGKIVNGSGTVSNAQFAAGRGIPAIALSAGSNTAGAEDDAGNHGDNPLSVTVADLSVHLIEQLQAKAGRKSLLPEGVALNVNFPDTFSAETRWEFSRHGSYDRYDVKFVADLSQDPVAQSYGLGSVPYPGITIGFNAEEPTRKQLKDESVVISDGNIAVTPMQVGFDAGFIERAVTHQRLRGLLSR
ncbi:MAG: 5'/3'-nucleotidase SurE [Pseudomonadota bacterium]|nr:5'/3'-nucleotidase SurE [Pseudomonadota bacterium]